MDSHQERKEALFEATRELISRAEQAAYLDAACGDDPALRRQVERMLADEAAAEDFFHGIDALGESVRRAVITGNIFAGPMRIANNSKGNVRIAENADAP